MGSRLSGFAIPFGVLVIAIVAAANLGLLGLAHQTHEIPLADTVGQFIIYGILNLLVILAISEAHLSWEPARVALVCTLTLVLLTGLEEVSQRYVSARTFSIRDFAAGSLGILLLGGLAVGKARISSLRLRSRVQG